MKQTLKKLSAFMMAMAISGALFAQVPQKFNYQGIARDNKGNPMAQQRMTLKLTVLPASDAIEGEYEEIQSVTTNEFGLYNLQIGNGTPVKGEMKTVKWETGNKYIKVAIDPKGGNDFVDAGTTQLLSVPYAIYADKAGMAKNTGSTSRATNNFIEKTNGSGVVNSTSQIFDNGTNIGIGTTTPSAKFHINQNVAGVQEHFRMQNLSTTGAGRFTLYSDGASNYSTFTKYGSAYLGGYAGITSLYPLGNLLAFGNNGLASGDGLGRFLISTAGNAGISIFKSGISKLKFHADFTTENVGIGGNAAPVSRVHLNNTDGTTMDLRLTNTTTGQTATDGMTIAMTGNNASINNIENAALTLGTNNTTRMTVTAAGNVGIDVASPTHKLSISDDNSQSLYVIGTGNNVLPAEIAFDKTVAGAQHYSATGYSTSRGHFVHVNGVDRMNITTAGDIGIGTTAPAAKLDVAGTIKISGGAPGAGKVLTSDATGLATWQTPSGGGSLPSGTTSQTLRHNGTTWVANSALTNNGNQVGIGTSTPLYPLHFGPVTGLKISLYNQGPGYDGYAFGNEASELRIAGGVGSGDFISFKTQGYTNGSERLRITGDGNVGIGTNTPAAKLDVSGQVRISGGAPGVGKVLTSDANGLATWETPSGGGSLPVGTTDQTLRHNGTTWVANSALTNNGNQVGIGIAASNVAPLTFANLVGQKINFFPSQPDGYCMGVEASDLRFAGGNSGLDAITFRTQGYNGTERLRIAGNGNVGLGTSTPLYPLHFGPVTGLKISLYNQGPGYDGYAFGNEASELRIAGGVGSGDFIAFTTQGYSNGSERLRITGAGNVGIGTNTPTSTLSVNGTADKPGGGSWAVFSDRRLKNKIVPYQDGLNTLLKINPVKFHYNEKAGCDTKPEYVGVIAQELNEVAPYMVGHFQIDQTDYLNVDNSAMTYMLINAVKELSSKLESQQEINKSQQELIEKLAKKVDELSSK